MKEACKTEQYVSLCSLSENILKYTQTTASPGGVTHFYSAILWLQDVLTSLNPNTEIKIFHILFEHMLKQSGNIDKSGAQIRTGEQPRASNTRDGTVIPTLCDRNTVKVQSLVFHHFLFHPYISISFLI